MARMTKQAQVKEIIKCGKDPNYFFKNYLKIQHPVRGLIPFEMYPFQEECVEEFTDHRFNIILKSRQETSHIYKQVEPKVSLQCSISMFYFNVLY